MPPIHSLSKMPKTVPEGKILAHNRGQPTSKLGSRAFKAWFDDPSDRYEPCTCGWAANLPQHYQLRERGSGVPIERTKGEIEAVLTDYGAVHFHYLADGKGAIVMFDVRGLRLQFNLPLDDAPGASALRFRNQRWRELLQCIQAKLESMRSGIESFEEAFLAHVVTPDGKTVYEHMAPQIAQFANACDVQLLLLQPQDDARL